QRVQDGDRAGAHREDVAQDPADAGGGALVWLDRRRAVGPRGLEGDGEPITDRDDARVLTRARDDALATGRERPEERLRALVRAMLRPHDAEHRELEIIRVAPEAIPDGVELLVRQPKGPMQGNLGRRGPLRVGG